jgi:hypothetical protein
VGGERWRKRSQRASLVGPARSAAGEHERDSLAPSAHAAACDAQSR